MCLRLFPFLILLLHVSGQAPYADQPSQEKNIRTERMFTLPGGATMEMVWIAPGMVSTVLSPSGSGQYSDEGSQYEVTINQGFYLGKYEVTQAQWQSVLGTTPWSGENYVQANPDCPAVYISWNDVQSYVLKLNDAAGDSLYRLPSEVEWEYTCLAGANTVRPFGDDENTLGEYAWYYGNTWNAGLTSAQAVGTRSPNPWGLYDMFGNVWEWCQDPYEEDRVVRGGSFNSRAWEVQSAGRSSGSPSSCYADIGVRLLRMAE